MRPKLAAALTFWRQNWDVETRAAAHAARLQTAHAKRMKDVELQLTGLGSDRSQAAESRELRTESREPSASSRAESRVQILSTLKESYSDEVMFYPLMASPTFPLLRLGGDGKVCA